MSKITESSLRNFFIFNSTLSHKDTDENKKILFYHPSSVDLDTKMKDIGLSEAIIKFTENFILDDDDECNELRTQKTTQLFHQPERDFWMIMTINAPYESKSKDGNDSIDYKNGEIHNKIYSAALRQAYQMFKLFAGTFELNFIGESEEERATNLKQKLDIFYTKYVLTIKLAEHDIIDVTRSVQYLPLEKMLFLRIYNFINMIQSTFPQIEQSVFLYNEQLIWSEINSSDLYSIHKYLISTLFPKAIQCDLQGVERSNSYDFNRYSTFLCGPENFEDSIKAPKVYLTMNGVLKCFHFIVYRAFSATICLFIDGNDVVGEDFYQEIHSFMKPQLSAIGSEIGEIYSKNPQISSNKSDEPKFLFLNELNLQHDGNLHLDQQGSKYTSIPKNVINLIADLYSNEKNGKFEEVCLKAVNDYWVVKKTSNWRQFYVIIHNNKATLLDITNEAKKYFDQHAVNMFFDK